MLNNIINIINFINQIKFKSKRDFLIVLSKLFLPRTIKKLGIYLNAIFKSRCSIHWLEN